MKKDILEKLEKKYQGKKVLIWGLGLHGGGVGAAKFFAGLGAKVLVTDMKSEKELKSSIAKLKKHKNISYRLGEHLEKDFINSDFIIRNPAVKDDNRFLVVAKKAGVKIENDVGIFFENSPAYIIGVTGTKGKSTVTNLLYDLVKYEVEKNKGTFGSTQEHGANHYEVKKDSGVLRLHAGAMEPTSRGTPQYIEPFDKANKAFLGGNIRKSVFDCLLEADEKSIVVFELSSAQLHHARYAKRSPNVAVITNIYPEHISFHFSLENYIEAKREIYKYQNSSDYLIANKKTKKLLGEPKGKVIYFEDTNEDALDKFANIFEIPKSDIKKILKENKGLEGRKEFVAEINGRKFINDTTATHPSAVSYALEEFKKPILIMGGLDKMFGRDVGELAKKIETRGIKTVMLPGDFSDKIKQLFGFDYKQKNVFDVGSMDEAVAKAYSLSKKGDTILLSPGGASFNLFINEFDRGDKFVKAVKKIKG